MRPVRLTTNDVRWAMEVGQTRWRRAQNMKSKARFEGAQEKHHLIGAAGELAFCRALDIPWPASIDSYSRPDRPDVFPNWEVRTSPQMRGIKVTDTDPDDRLVVWVVGDIPNRNQLYTVMGYIRAGGAKSHMEWKQDPGNRNRAFWKVPERNMIVIDQTFHDACQFLKLGEGRFGCAFCGKGSGEEPVSASQ